MKMLSKLKVFQPKFFLLAASVVNRAEEYESNVLKANTILDVVNVFKEEVDILIQSTKSDKDNGLKEVPLSNVTYRLGRSNHMTNAIKKLSDVAAMKVFMSGNEVEQAVDRAVALVSAIKHAGYHIEYMCNPGTNMLPIDALLSHIEHYQHALGECVKDLSELITKYESLVNMLKEDQTKEKPLSRSVEVTGRSNRDTPTKKVLNLVDPSVEDMVAK